MPARPGALPRLAAALSVYNRRERSGNRRGSSASAGTRTRRGREHRCPGRRRGARTFTAGDGPPTRPPRLGHDQCDEGAGSERTRLRPSTLELPAVGCLASHGGLPNAGARSGGPPVTNCVVGQRTYRDCRLPKVEIRLKARRQKPPRQANAHEPAPGIEDLGQVEAALPRVAGHQAQIGSGKRSLVIAAVGRVRLAGEHVCHSLPQVHRGQNRR